MFSRAENRSFIYLKLFIHVSATIGKFWKQEFSRIPSHGLKWDNKPHKLKRSIDFYVYWPIAGHDFLVKYWPFSPGHYNPPACNSTRRAVPGSFLGRNMWPRSATFAGQRNNHQLRSRPAPKVDHHLKHTVKRARSRSRYMTSMLLLRNTFDSWSRLWHTSHVHSTVLILEELQSSKV